MLELTNQLSSDIAQIAKAAGSLIMHHYKGEVAVQLKGDQSPVTIADQEANQLIVDALKVLTPDTPIIAEESVKDGEDASQYEEFWLVDPLDGTKEFINKNGEFTVNIALIRSGMPVMGVVHIPTPGNTYIAPNMNEAFLESMDGSRLKINTRQIQNDCPTVVVSRSHPSPQTHEFLKQFEEYDTIPKGSSLKFCVIASGKADIYPRFGRTMEWDTAAGHAVLLAAGGHVETVDGQPLVYGKSTLDNPHFIAWGHR